MHVTLQNPDGAQLLASYMSKGNSIAHSLYIWQTGTHLKTSTAVDISTAMSEQINSCKASQVSSGTIAGQHAVPLRANGEFTRV